MAKIKLIFASHFYYNLNNGGLFLSDVNLR